MEHRHRTISNILDQDIADIGKQIHINYDTSVSIDETLDEYTEYMYNGTFSIYNVICCGFLKLICPCCCRKRVAIKISD